MAINEQAGSYDVTTKVVTMTKVKPNARPSLKVDESANYSVVFAGELEGTERYVKNAGGVLKLVGRIPKVGPKAVNFANTMRAIMAVLTGRVGYTLEGGISQETREAIAKAEDRYDARVAEQRAVIGNYRDVAQDARTGVDVSTAKDLTSKF